MIRVLIALSLLTHAAVAQLPERWFDGGVAGRAYGRSVTTVDDLDGDGVDDYAVVLPTTPFLGVDGIVRLVSSFDGALLGDVFAPPPSGLPFSGFGERVDVVGDYDADGRRDIAIWQGTNLRGFFSSLTFTLLRDFNGSAFSNIREVVSLEDMNGDGLNEYAWQRANTATTAVLEILDGASGNVIATSSAPGIPGPLVTVHDIDGDGYRDLARSVPSGGLSSTGTSTLILHSSANGGVINSITGSSAFARQLITGDFDGDLIDDLAVATTFGPAVIEIMDGTTLGSLLVTDNITGPPAVGFGEHMTAADISADGIDDLVFNEGGIIRQYRVNSGQAPAQLLSLSMASPFSNEIHALGSIRDRDGLDDIVVGFSSPGIDLGSISAFGYHGGRRYGARSGPAPQPRLTWDSYLTTNQGGRLQLTMATPNGAGFGLASFAPGSLMTFGIEVLVNTSPLLGFQIENLFFDAQGEWALELALVQPLLAGQSLFVQVVDPNGAVRSTEGVELAFLP